MNKKKVFIEILPNFNECNPQFVQWFQEQGYEVELCFSEGKDAVDEETFLKKFAGCDACIVCIHPVTVQMMNSAPNLKVIAEYGVGVDKIDVPAATKRGIAVTNTAGGNAIAVAEMTIGHMLSLSRSIQLANINMKSGIWKNYVGTEMHGKTYGLMGMGAIGEQVAKIAKFGMQMQILAYDVFPRQEYVEKYGVQYVDLDTLFKESDYISIHTPLLPSTKGIVNSKLIGKMKKTAIIVNASRGGVLDENALYDALEEKRIAGAGLDVYEHEPHCEGRFAKFSNVVNTCHMAGNTIDSIIRMGKTIQDNVFATLERGSPECNILNPDYLKNSF